MTEVEAKELNERLLGFVSSQLGAAAFVDVIDIVTSSWSRSRSS